MSSGVFNNLSVNQAFLTTNLTVSKNLTVTGKLAAPGGFTTAGSISVGGNVAVNGHFTAPNLTSNVQLAKDRWHLPTPTGPFAVDIIPVAANNFSITMDLFGEYSSKYWGTETFSDGAYATIIAPSNRTGAAKDVSASLTGCMDPSDPSKTLACGTLLYHPDDFVFMTAIAGNYAKYCGDESSEGYIGFIDAISALNNKFSYAPFDRSALIDLWSNIENTYTYQNLHRHFSVATGKIWHQPQETVPGTSYKRFSKHAATDPILSADGAQLFDTTWTPAELPTEAEIFAATGNTKCPVVIKVAGTTSNELQFTDVWHSFELASRGFIVIQLGYVPCGLQPEYKVDTNQTVIDCIRNGYLGDGINFDPRTIPNFTNYATNKNSSSFTGNYNDPAGTNTLGFPQDERIPSTYTDENGRTDPEPSQAVDTVNVAYNLWFNNNLSHDNGVNKSYYTPQAVEKWLYILKNFATSINGFESRINFNNVSYCGFSMGGALFSQAQKVTGNNGNAYYLGNLDQYGNVVVASGTVPLFKIDNAMLFEPTLINSKQENLGWLYENRKTPDGQDSYNYKYPQTFGTYNNPGPFIFANENMCPFEEGFTVPVLSICTTGPVLLVLDWNLCHTTEALQYNLQKTRIYNEPVADKCLVYSIGTKHAHLVDVVYDADTTNNVQDAIIPEYPFFFSGGWDWPVETAFPGIIYNNGEIESIQTQQLADDVQKTSVFVMWNLHTQCLDPATQTKGVTVAHLMEYGNKGSGKLQIGTNYLESSIHIDGFFRYIGPHKLETVRDPVNNMNHFSIDFGKNTIYENRSNAIVITSRPGYTPKLVFDGEGASISSNTGNMSVTSNLAVSQNMSVTSNLTVGGLATGVGSNVITQAMLDKLYIFANSL